MLQHRGAAQPQLVRAQQELGEVHHATAFTGRFIGAVDLQHGVGEDVPRGHLDMLGAQALVLLRVDIPLGLPRRPAALVQLQLATDALYQAQLVIAVEYLEVLGQNRFLPVGLQQAVGQAMKRAHPHALRRDLQHVLYTATHFPGRLVGEGHRQYRPGRKALRAHQPGDAMHQYPGLAAAGTGQHQHVLVLGSYRVALGIIQGGENIGYVHGRILTKYATGHTVGGHWRQ